jgi:hypothetical protein
MKNTIKLLGIIALVAVIGFAMAACASSGGTDSPPPASTAPTAPTATDGGTTAAPTKVVEEKYRWSNGTWWSEWPPVPGAVSEKKKNTFTVNGGGVNISYTGVYTEGDVGGNMAVLYDRNGTKIGIVVIGSNLQAEIGKTQLENNYGKDNTMSVGMQNTYNGFARAP